MPDTYTIGSSDRENFSLCVVTDTHYWPGGGSFYGGDGSLQLLGWSEQLLSSLMSEVNKAGMDLLLHLGDVTCGGGTYPITEDEFHGAQKATHEGLTSIGIPAYALPGNHDCPPGGGPWTDFERRWDLQPGMGSTIDTPFARLVMLNAQGHTLEQVEAAHPEDPIYGWVSHAELARLDEALANAGDLPVILFLHQLLQSCSGDHPCADYHLVANAEAVHAVLARHGNVRALFQGHAHRFNVQQPAMGDSSYWSIVCPAIMQYPVGWLAVTISQRQVRVQFRSLPLPNLRLQALDSGDGQAWRAGQPEWHDFTIIL